MICCICEKEMNIFEGLVEIDNKRCHLSCKEQFEQQWRKIHNLDHKF